MLKHLWAGLYGGILMIAIFATSQWWPESWAMTRYDGLLLIAVATQAAFIVLKLEATGEIIGVVVFCLLGLGLEWFNTARGNWSYPEDGYFTFAHVPLFVGFMYAAVGVCVLRMIRIFQMRFSPFPTFWVTLALAVLIYVNFFTQHLWFDIRIGLFAAIALLFARTRIWFRVAGKDYWMPMLLSLALSALGVWLAENLGTLTGTWAYDGQDPFEMVSLATLGSWFLFLCVALVTALIVIPDATDTAI